MQIRHLVVDKPELAELLKQSVEELKGTAARVKMLMRLAEKYSRCASREDGGNLGWIELSCNDPRIRNYDPVLENVELEEFIRDAVRNHKLRKGVVIGPVKTAQGYHVVLAANEFGAENATDFTGSSV